MKILNFVLPVLCFFGVMQGMQSASALMQRSMAYSDIEELKNSLADKAVRPAALIKDCMQNERKLKIVLFVAQGKVSPSDLADCDPDELSSPIFNLLCERNNMDFLTQQFLPEEVQELQDIIVKRNAIQIKTNLSVSSSASSVLKIG